MTADTRDKVFDYIVKDKIYEDILVKFFPSNKDNRDEFRSLLWIQIGNLDDSKLIEAWNQNYFIYLYTAIVRNQVKSSNSYWHKEKKNNFVELFDESIDYESDNSIEEIEIKKFKEEKIKMIEEAIKNMDSNPNNYVEANLFKLYFYKQMSYRKISKKTNIPLRSVYDYVQRAIVIVKGYIMKKYGTNLDF